MTHFFNPQNIALRYQQFLSDNQTPFWYEHLIAVVRKTLYKEMPYFSCLLRTITTLSILLIVCILTSLDKQF